MITRAFQWGMVFAVSTAVLGIIISSPVLQFLGGMLIAAVGLPWLGYWITGRIIDPNDKYKW